MFVPRSGWIYTRKHNIISIGPFCLFVVRFLRKHGKQTRVTNSNETQTQQQKKPSSRQLETTETVSHHPEGTSMDSDNCNTISLSLRFIMVVLEIKILIITEKEEMCDNNNTTEIFHTIGRSYIETFSVYIRMAVIITDISA